MPSVSTASNGRSRPGKGDSKLPSTTVSDSLTQRVDRTVKVATRPSHRQRARASRRLAVRALARTPANSRRDISSCTSDALSTSWRDRAPRAVHKTSGSTIAYRSATKEPRTNATFRPNSYNRPASDGQGAAIHAEAAMAAASTITRSRVYATGGRRGVGHDAVSTDAHHHDDSE